MTVVPVAYDIPDDILAGLMSGVLERFGSVVRDGTGIIAHLKEVDLPAGESSPDVTAMAAALKNPKLLIGLGVVVLAAAGGVAIWAATRKPVDRHDVPKSVVEYNSELATYIEAIKSGSLDAAVLSRLLSAVEAVKADSDEGAITIELSIGQSEALVNIVADYTRVLAEANSVDLGEGYDRPPSPSGNPVVDLRHWLKLQHRIFDETA
jgi:hypothetical protein